MARFTAPPIVEILWVHIDPAPAEAGMAFAVDRDRLNESPASAP